MRRALTLAGLLLLLAGCGGEGDRAPFAESRIPPALSPRFWAPEGWSWGFIQVGQAPAQRYGVASTSGRPAASVLILTGYGESAEAWFETVGDLAARGYTVWVLERAGQGGSQRYVSPRDLGHAPTFDDDVAATRALLRMIQGGAPDTPVILVGHSVGGLIALRAAETGAAVDGLVLSAPAFAGNEKVGQAASLLVRAGLGRVPAAFGQGWTREGPDARASGLTGDSARGAVEKAWQIANPDLRMGGQSLGWRAAFRQTSRDAMAGLTDVRPPVLLLSAGADRNADPALQAKACRALPRCVLTRLPGARHALHLEIDATRGPWLAALDGFIRERIAAREAIRPRRPGHQM